MLLASAAIFKSALTRPIVTWVRTIVAFVWTVSYVLSELVRNLLGNSLALVALGAQLVYRLNALQESTEEWKELPQKLKDVLIAHQATTVLLERPTTLPILALVVLTAQRERP